MANSATAMNSVSAERGYHKCSVACYIAPSALLTTEARQRAHLSEVLRGRTVECLPYKEERGDGEDDEDLVRIARARYSPLTRLLPCRRRN